MPRKKMMRSTKGNKMKAKTTSVSSQIEKMEKDFRNAPAKIAAQYRKEASMVKKQENKLSTELKKAQSLEKTLKNKHSVLQAKKLTSAAKKRLAKEGKVLAQLIKGIQVVTKQLENLKQVWQKLSAKHAMYSALAKEVVQFEKEFAKKQTNVTKAKSVVKTKKKKSVAKPVAMQSSQPEMEQPTEMISTVKEVVETVDANS